MVLRTQPDRRLAALVREGSEPAFEAIVQRHRRALLAYCRRLLVSDSRSEDVVQQACLCAWSALRAGTEVRELRPWLFRITHNQAMSALRRPGYDFDELTESLRGADAPQADLERRMHVRETLAAVAALPELQREVILRTAIDGCSYEQVADALGLSGGAVRGLVYRARISLRSGLAVLAPGPLVIWAAGQGRRAGTAVQWLGETLAGGGSAGGAVVAVKGVALLATTAVLAGGTVGRAIEPGQFHAPVARRQSSAARNSPAPASSVRGSLIGRTGGSVSLTRARSSASAPTRAAVLASGSTSTGSRSASRAAGSSTAASVDHERGTSAGGGSGGQSSQSGGRSGGRETFAPATEPSGSPTGAASGSPAPGGGGQPPMSPNDRSQFSGGGAAQSTGSAIQPSQAPQGSGPSSGTERSAGDAATDPSGP